MKLTTMARIGASALLLLPSIALAANANIINLNQSPFQTATKAAQDTADTAKIGGGQGDLTVIIGRIINVLLSFLGVVFLVLVLYAGFLWMTAQGDTKKVDQAKSMITQAIIGLIIIMAAYAISSYVLSALAAVTTG